MISYEQLADQGYNQESCSLSPHEGHCPHSVLRLLFSSGSSPNPQGIQKGWMGGILA